MGGLGLNTERSINVSTLVAGICWLVGLGVAVGNLLFEIDLGGVAGAFFAGAICLTIRAAIKQASLSALQAFQLGKETERRRQDGPPPIRGV